MNLTRNSAWVARPEYSKGVGVEPRPGWHVPSTRRAWASSQVFEGLGELLPFTPFAD